VLDRINTWIDDNFDQLYKDSNKVQFYKNNTGFIDQENKQKCQFMKYLKDNAEELVLKHKIIQRKKSVNQIQFKLNQKLPYDEKNAILEYEIEGVVKGFNSNRKQIEQFKKYMSIKKKLMRM